MATGLPQLKVGRYELIHEVGRGQSTVVYKAQDSLLARIVALKTIEVPPAVVEAEGEEFRRRFFQEARVAGRLSHPGLVAVHDVGHDPRSGHLYIAFEYVEGRLLDAVAGAHPMPWREAFRISARIAEALQHAHENGVVHRDVSPSNIMIGGSGDPKVLDFGLARWATARLKMTTTGQFLGSPLYLSPEQVGGQSHVDGRSDVFSLGAVLYRLLTGRHAFAAKATTEILRRIAEEDPAPPSSLVSSLPQGVDDLVRHALAKKPAHRYADARSMAEDLHDVLAGRPGRHCRPAPATEDEPLLTLLEQATSAPPPITPVPPPADAVESRRVETATDPKALPVHGTYFPGEHTLLRRRAFLRGVIGALLLAIVAVAHFTRGTTGDPAPVPVASPPAGAARATPPPLRSEAAEEDLERAPVEPGQLTSDQGDPARLVLDLEHPLQAGTVVVYVNGEKVLQRRLRAAVTNNILGFKLRRQRLRETVSLPPGRKRVLVQVLWKDGRRSETIAGTFKPGATRRLSARMGRVGKGLSLEWR